jgi:arsenate reductase
MKILILCTGNSCRSLMAQRFLLSFDSRPEVFSAGTYPASKVNPKANKVIAEAGIDISGHSPISAGHFINDSWDYVITVCDSARETSPVFTGNVKSRLHIGFEDPSAIKGTDDFITDEFRRIRDLIKYEFYRFYVERIISQL